MSRVKAISASAVFLVFTLVKLAFPGVMSDMRRVIVPRIREDTDFRLAMINLGERVTGEGGIIAALGRLYESKPTEPSADAEIPNLAANADPSPAETLPQPTPEYSRTPSAAPEAEPSPQPTEEAAPAPTPEPTPESTPEPTATPEAVAAFFAAQSEYAAQEPPANVSYDMPELAFEYVAPVSGFNSSGFGFRMHPIEGRVKFHYGTDIAAYHGTDIAAFADGVVSMSGNDVGYGLYLIVSHADGFSTLYAHCSAILVETGENVSGGQKIAQVGATGAVTGAHLHFELLRDEVYLNPEYYLG